MKPLMYIQKERAEDVEPTVQLIRALLLENPTPPASAEELFGYINTISRRMQTCIDKGELLKLRALLSLLAVKLLATMHSPHKIHLDFENPYFINQDELDQMKEAA